MIRFFRQGGVIAWMVVTGLVLALAISVKLLKDTAELRYQRDVNRMVFNDNLGVLAGVRAKLGLENAQMLKRLEALRGDSTAPYIVVSIAENRLWFKQYDSVLFSTRVATASGKTLVGNGGNQQWRFETPRGRLSVIDKDEGPAWVPPDWHYIEQANKRGLGVTRLNRGEAIRANDGATYLAQGSDVVRQFPDGRVEPVLPGEEGRELVVDGRIVIPPYGTNQRRYMGVMGTRRLRMPDGYAIHGTNNPASIGRSVSHGCIRMLNADIERLYPMVPIGTMVYIY